jgi:glutaredoxin
MPATALFYHAGCPVCIAAEQHLAAVIDPRRYQVTSIHLGQDKGQLAAAKTAGVQSVPALVLDGQVFHINFGAAIGALG